MLNTTIARKEDIPALVPLINSAYRATEGIVGWTHEGHLLEGPRTDEEGLEELVSIPGSVLLLGRDAAGTIMASVHLQKQDDALYFGMLAVDPRLQSQGVGNAMMQAAKDYAQANHCQRIKLTVLSQRTELVAWYQRRGFVVVDTHIDFPAGNRFGKPKEKLVLWGMEWSATSPTSPGM